MPVYNVERYLSACLDSLLAQSYADFEVVMIDDGSTDSSADIARAYTTSDPRFRLVRQENAGLAAARNAGVSESRGEYLTFLDSDDLLPADAYERLMSTIERTGSDLVVGRLEQDHGERRTTGRLMRENHLTRRESVQMIDVPLLLADVFAVNKIYRRSFWTEADLSFPEGVRYEDQPTLTRALLAADRIDVIPETVYLWRIREDGTSITQGRGDLADLVDRTITKRWSTEAVVQHAPWARDVWFRKILPVDMWMYFRAATTGSDEYWARLRDAVREFWHDGTIPFDKTQVPAQQRLMGWLVAADRREDLVALVDFVDGHRPVPLAVRDGALVGALPGLDDPEYGAPPDVYAVESEELPWRNRLLAATWDGRQIRLEGFSLVVGMPALGRSAGFRARALGAAGSSVALRAERRHEPRATAAVGRPGENYDASGFAVTVDLGDLARPGPDEASTGWRFELELDTGAASYTGPLEGCRPGVCDEQWRPIDGDHEARLSRDDRGVVLEFRARP